MRLRADVMDEGLYKKILSYVPLFRCLTPKELEAIVAVSRLIRVKQETVLIREGDSAFAMYVLVEGKVRVFKQLANGETTVLADLVAPSVFGEMALIDRSPRSASVGTISDAILYRVDLEGFNRLRAAYHSGAYKVLRELAVTLCKRVRVTSERIGRFLENPRQEADEMDIEFRGTSELSQ